MWSEPVCNGQKEADTKRDGEGRREVAMMWEVWISFYLMSALKAHFISVLCKLICISLICILIQTSNRNTY